ncbi:reprolysin-like metallopeptidase [Nonlabens ponticola]|uniref:T9SS type A sorting domain-containing protein n=1 Tax=Nonlabens ponticola TaxID=2496866 RepID=A0A3S9N0Y0_9FLAO|nr:zinc-dependent metalloprotease family protein [Nonlabens ponticola]AZQ44973.1 T9SS type A sorting domain-containing protein [Nonlabens ponticola]
MKNTLLLSIAAFVAMTISSNAQIWTPSPISTFSKSISKERQELIAKSDTYQVDIDAISALLVDASDRFSGNDAIEMPFPTGNGTMVTFSVYKSGAMSPLLEERYPEIRSYYGFNPNNPLQKIFFSITPQGLYGTIDGERISYLSPAQKGIASKMIVYDRSDMLRSDSDNFTCEFDDSEISVLEQVNSSSIGKAFSDRALRTYTIAVSTTSEYSAYHDDGDDTNGNIMEDALAAIVITMTRVNSVFERDMAIRFQLNDYNDYLIFYNGRNRQGRTDTFDNYSATQMLYANTGVINNIIGSQRYDIGHIFSTGGGGVASPVRCTNSSKGQGVTGIVTPEFDAFDIDYVSHEIGHQFGASHTFYNGCFGGSPSSAPFESGSASTIMGYAGICGPNVQDNSDAYFHHVSIAQMHNALQDDTCDAQTSLGILNPNGLVIDDVANKTIPKSTPFKLTANASTGADDNEILTYNWEQYDFGAAAETGAPQPPRSTNDKGPMFRSKFATINPTRFFPNLKDLSVGIDPVWETLPSVERDMTFYCTVRDNNPFGGQTNFTQVTLSVGSSGPLTVNNPTNSIWYGNSQQTITWNVNGTNANTYSPTVNIKLSLDGGLTYPIELANSVTNNGSHEVTVPEVATTNARIMVEAAQNVFFNINSTNFEIKSGSFELIAANDLASSCKPADASMNVTYDAAPGFEEPATFQLTGLPAALNATLSTTTATADTSLNISISGTQNVLAGAYPFQLTATTASLTVVKDLILKVFNNNIDEVIVLSPANGAGNQDVNTTIEWQDLASANGYEIVIATDPTLTQVVETATIGNVTSYNTTSLVPGNLYYWSIKASNDCGSSEYSKVYAFQTSQVVTRTYDDETYFNEGSTPDNTWNPNTNNAISVKVNITDDIEMTDVSFYMNATHGRTGDIKMQFRGPSGTFSEVYNRDCAEGRNFNVTVTDNSSVAFACTSGSRPNPLSGTRFPGQSFKRFHGESSKGTWELLATDRDTRNGNGGTFNDFSVTITGRLQYVNDFSSSNQELSAFFNGISQIQTSTLSSTQAGATTTDMVYVLSKLPVYGQITRAGITLGLGATFTQADIDNGSIAYSHTSDELVYNDAFDYVLLGKNNTIDGEKTMAINIEQPILTFNNFWEPFAPRFDTQDLTATVISGEATIDSEAFIGELFVDAGQSLVLNSTLNVSGDLFVDGTISTSNLGELVLDAPNVSITGTGDVQVHKLTVPFSSLVDINVPVRINGVLTPNDATINTNDLLTLGSSENGTAQVANLDQATITGNVIVEQYIPARRAFRFIAPTVNSSKTIYENWQENGTTIAGLGTHITGSNTGANGFDQTASGNPSLFTFNNDTQRWQAISNTDVNKPTVGTGYRMLVRGDRTVDLSSNTATATNTILRSIGTLNPGAVNTNYATSDQDFVLVANPYQAAVDATALMGNAQTSGVATGFVYVWDATLNERGAYVAVEINEGNGEPTPSNSSASKFLQPGQSFFVKATGASQFEFTQSMKALDQPIANVFDIQQPSKSMVVSLNNDQGTILDQVKLRFDASHNNEVDDNDAAKFYNQDETFAISSYDKLLSIERRQDLELNEQIKLHMDRLRSTRYAINVQLNGVENADFVLVDNYLETETVIANDQQISFTVSDDEQSKAADRFYIKRTSGTLSSDDINLDSWTMYPNPSQGKFTIENLATNQSAVKVEIFNALGQNIYSQNDSFDGRLIIEPTTRMSSGLYMVKVTSGEHSITRQLVIE